jgi:hypothetical protein
MIQPTTNRVQNQNSFSAPARKCSGAVEAGSRLGNASSSIPTSTYSLRTQGRYPFRFGSTPYWPAVSRVIHQGSNMRFTNPSGVLGIRLATESAVPVWSGFSLRTINGAHPLSPANAATAAKVSELKTLDARSAVFLIVSALACFSRCQKGFPEEYCGVGGVMSQRAESVTVLSGSPQRKGKRME